MIAVVSVSTSKWSAVILRGRAYFNHFLGVAE